MLIAVEFLPGDLMETPRLLKLLLKPCLEVLTRLSENGHTRRNVDVTVV